MPRMSDTSSFTATFTTTLWLPWLGPKLHNAGRLHGVGMKGRLSNVVEEGCEQFDRVDKGRLLLFCFCFVI